MWLGSYFCSSVSAGFVWREPGKSKKLQQSYPKYTQTHKHTYTQCTFMRSALCRGVHWHGAHIFPYSQFITEDRHTEREKNPCH